MKFKIAIFASGGGTNAENLARYFHNNEIAEVSIMITNRSTAGVIERAKNLGIPCFTFTKEELSNGQFITEFLKSQKIDFVVLAGYLLKIPGELVNHFQGKMVNIHPALLPAFGGKGMYGMHVHNAVIAAKEQYSGITIHLVNERYDEGGIIFQARYALTPEETPESLAKEIQKLEHQHFPQVVEKYIKEKLIT